VPAARLVVVSPHTGAPVLHAIAPRLHGLELVVHVALAVHAPQAPEPSQTRLVPQLAPAATSVEPLVQTEAPVSQAVTPTTHRLELVVHVALAVQAAQVPAAVQTLFVPQLVPGVSLVELSTQTSVPVVQDVMPSLQAEGLVVHAVPATQLPQLPLLQVWPEPHCVPFGRLVVPSSHVAAPEVHETRPALHGLGLVEHAPPVVQLAHAPVPSQTRLVPQVAPAAVSLVPSTQTAAPVVHETAPSLQRLGLVAQLAPSEQVLQTPALQN